MSVAGSTISEPQAAANISPLLTVTGTPTPEIIFQYGGTASSVELNNVNQDGELQVEAINNGIGTWLTIGGTIGTAVTNGSINANLVIYSDNATQEQIMFIAHRKTDYMITQVIGTGAYRPFIIQNNGVTALTISTTPTVDLSVRVGKVMGIATAGLGVPGIYASYTNTAQTGALTNVINYTPPAAAGRYRISWIVDTTTATTDSFKVVVTYKNATGTARTQNSGGWDINGTSLAAGAITNVIGAGNYYGFMMIDIDNSATAITLSTAGTFTTVTYNISAVLEQLA